MTTADVAKAAFQGFVLEFHIAELFTILGILENKHNLPQLINCMQSFNLKYNDISALRETSLDATAKNNDLKENICTAKFKSLAFCAMIVAKSIIGLAFNFTD
ncbi:unnamed protein product [Orchesella dallaii]|uniref:Uncharacterized protein n=1 Tax=Orchesella dallaii TaxID=48710 RepID=A0ABP1RJZ6_9HEXA